MKKTKIVLLSNPSNPTGTVLLKEELFKLARFVKKHNLILISDETYDFLIYDGVKHISAGSIPSIRDRVIVTSSFSKKYRMTGYRLGYAFADEGIIDHMLKVHDALAICAPAISQEATITALKENKKSQKSVKELVYKLTVNRKTRRMLLLFPAPPSDQAAKITSDFLSPANQKTSKKDSTV